MPGFGNQDVSLSECVCLFCERTRLIPHPSARMGEHISDHTGIGDLKAKITDDFHHQV